MKDVSERKNPLLRCDEIMIKQRTIKIMSFEDFIEYIHEHYDEPYWSGNLFTMPFTHEKEDLYLIASSDGSITRFNSDEILIIDFTHGHEVYFSTITKVNFYNGRGFGWYDVKIGTDYSKYKSKSK